MKELKTIYTMNTVEYRKLQLFGEMLNLVAFEFDMKIRFNVQNTYVDFGQNWMYTTVICTDLTEMEKGNTITASWQFLKFAEYDRLLANGDDYMFELFKKKKEQLIEKYYLKLSRLEMDFNRRFRELSNDFDNKIVNFRLNSVFCVVVEPKDGYYVLEEKRLNEYNVVLSKGMTIDKDKEGLKRTLYIYWKKRNVPTTYIPQY